MASNLIRLPKVMEKTGFSEPWIYRLMSQKRKRHIETVLTPMQM